jgi:hypothetical protein
MQKINRNKHFQTEFKEIEFCIKYALFLNTEYNNFTEIDNLLFYIKNWLFDTEIIKFYGVWIYWFIPQNYHFNTEISTILKSKFMLHVLLNFTENDTNIKFPAGKNLNFTETLKKNELYQI